jgi:hypothetical protein
MHNRIENWYKKMIIRITIYNAVPYLMLSLGLVALLVSAFSSSYIPGFIGLGLTFWGSLFLYLKPTKYVKLELLNATSSSALVNIEKILTNSETSLKGVYLPPNRLEDYTSSLVFIPGKPDQLLPTSKETDPQKLQSKNPKGLLITPPGLALSKLLEKELKKPFTETDLEEFQANIQKLFDALQISKNVAIEIEGSIVKVQVENHVFKDLCDETRKLKKTHETVGCPLSSALACALAKVTGKPVTIEKEETTTDETTSIEYKILED